MANTVDLFLNLRGQQEALLGVRGITRELEEAKQSTKRQGIVAQQERLKERLQIQQLAADERRRGIQAQQDRFKERLELQRIVVEERKREAILIGSRAAIRASISAQERYNALLRQQPGVQQGLQLRQNNGDIRAQAQLNAILRQQSLVSQRLRNFDNEVSQTGTTGWESLRRILQGQIYPLLANQLPFGFQRFIGASIQARGSISALNTEVTQGLGIKGLGAITALTLGIGVSLVGAINLASKALGFLGNQLLDTETETQRISERTKLQSIFNTDRAGGLALQQRNEQLVRELTPSSLSRENVLKLQTTFLDELKTQNPNLSSDEVFQRSIKAAQGFAAIQQTSGQDINQLRRNIDDIVSGTRTVNQIDNLEFFANLSPEQKRVFRQVYQEKGGVAALEAVAGLSETLLLIGEGADSTAARLNKLKDDLFGKRFGIFSVDRDLDLSTTEVESVRSEFNRTLDLLFGDKGLFQILGRTLGLESIDIMKGVRDSLRAFNDLLESVNRALDSSLKIFNIFNASGAARNIPSRGIQGGGFDFSTPRAPLVAPKFDPFKFTGNVFGAGNIGRSASVPSLGDIGKLVAASRSSEGGLSKAGGATGAAKGVAVSFANGAIQITAMEKDKAEDVAEKTIKILMNQLNEKLLPHGILT